MNYIQTSKQRSFLKHLASNLEPSFQIGKGGSAPEVIQALSELFHNRELVKLTVLKNCEEDLRSIAQMVSERTRSEVVQVIGRKIVLYKPFPDPEKRKILLPK